VQPASSSGGVCESDAGFLAAKAAHAALVSALASASAKAERLVGRAAAHADALADCGLAFVRLARLEDAEGARRGRYAAQGAAQRLTSAHARAAGAACVRACRLARAATGQMALRLAPLHTHLALAPAVQRAVAEREHAMLTWQTVAAERAAKLAKREKLRCTPLSPGGPWGLGGTTAEGKQSQMTTLESQIVALDAQIQSAQAAYATVALRNAQEFQRLSEQQGEDLLAMAMGSARVHAAEGRRAAAIWAPLADGVAVRRAEPDEGEGTG
jgi:hypothetical protein